MDVSFLNKIFISQFGAIKPLWIYKEVFYKLPFNFCDRWCERCGLSGICRVYQKEKESNKRFIKLGINPKSTEAMLFSITESFEETKNLLEKDIKRLKIKITKEDDKKFEKEEGKKDKLVKNDRLNLVSKKLCFSLVKLVEDFHYYFLEETPKEIKEPLKILNYYMIFFSVKIHRAILSAIEEKEMKYEDTTFDSKNSAFLSYVSIAKIINALKNISVYKNFDYNLKKKITKYLSLFENLNLVLKERFDLDF
ncbi:hypothetical protein HZA75_07985 [Candidatus Roizmanbacteria bacterium]|nr:hypothetical protein [Candidatus Roizmanbacteria bacterium]